MEARAGIVGARFRPPASWVLLQLGLDQPLQLRREPENAYDPNAIAVDLPGGWLERGSQEWAELQAECEARGCTVPDPAESLQLGYVPREVAEVWASVLDEEGSPPAKLGFGAAGEPQVVVEIAE